MAGSTRRKSLTDRLSSFPDDVLVKILSLLETKKAFCTSILSSRWKCLFASVERLDFDYYSRGTYFTKKGVPDLKDFINFVNKMLFLHNRSQIDTFRLNCPQDKDLDIGCIKGWICAALWRCVQNLEIEVHTQVNLCHTLPLCIFSGKTIVKLELGYGFFVEVPIKFSLPNMKRLTLNSIHFTDGDSAARLFSCSPVLEDLKIHFHPWLKDQFIPNIPIVNVSSCTLQFLTLSTGFGVSEPRQRIVLDTPNLVCFDYYDILAEGYILGSPIEAKINIHIFEDTIDYSSSITELLVGLSNARSLHVSESTMEIIQHFDILMPQLKVRTLEVGGPFHAQILQSCPNLETLTFEFPLPYYDEESECYLLVPEDVPFCVSSQLKTVHIKKFKGEGELYMVEYFLKNARVLKKLMIEFHTRIENSFEITKKLSTFPKSSQECQVVII